MIGDFHAVPLQRHEIARQVVHPLGVPSGHLGLGQHRVVVHVRTAGSLRCLCSLENNFVLSNHRYKPCRTKPVSIGILGTFHAKFIYSMLVPAIQLVAHKVDSIGRRTRS